MNCSVIITCFNKAQYIYEAILSACQQNTEIIVVDDGSQDNSCLEITLALRTREIKGVFQPNRGAAMARNRGISCSTGQYIIFMDGDDRLSNNCIAAHINTRSLFNASNEDVSYAPVRNLYLDGHITMMFEQQFESPIDYFSRGGGPVIHSWLWPRVLIDKAGYWRKDIIEHDDIEFAARHLKYCKRLLFVRNAYVDYRKLKTGLSHRASNEQSGESLLETAKTIERVALGFDDSVSMKHAVVQKYYDLLLWEPILRSKWMSKYCWSRIHALGGGKWDSLKGKHRWLVCMIGPYGYYQCYRFWFLFNRLMRYLLTLGKQKLR